MSAYKPVYSIEFESDIDSFEFDKNAADGLEKAIPIILERPYCCIPAKKQKHL